MFQILVHHFWVDPEDKNFDIDWIGDFIWKTDFDEGDQLVFDHPQEALDFVSKHKKDYEVEGNMYTIQIVEDDAYDEDYA